MVPTASDLRCGSSSCFPNRTCETSTTANSVENSTCRSGSTDPNIDNSVHPVEEASNAIFIASVSCAVILVFCILLGCGVLIVHRTKNKRRHHGTYSPSREEQSGGRRMELCQVLKPPPIERLI
ncbi:protein crumbs-like [Varroa jacobsoni]|uniref:Uncharacterized protein n=1 Tax=Varroa destructor TaxID=109461 RepID=A0A7M7MJJ3_VARDE|nr:protein crumbs-like [Varroa destructor]XP_022692955.1 protein crumbs-like [Varroa jacobsoni]XP_022692964.1 protein crumbs-like [Varroa jacobsoni]